jgi:hypothetical protein
VIGGLTHSEIIAIDNLVHDNFKSQIVLGSTHIMGSSDFVTHLEEMSEGDIGTKNKSQDSDSIEQALNKPSS